MPVANSTSNNNPVELRNELYDLVRQRKTLTDRLANLERQIYLFEGSYLDETAAYGNIIKGWERYLTSSSSALSSGGVNSTNSAGSVGAGNSQSVCAGSQGSITGSTNSSSNKRSAPRFREADRLFSLSSVTSSTLIGSNSTAQAESVSSNTPASSQLTKDDLYDNDHQQSPRDDLSTTPQGQHHGASISSATPSSGGGVKRAKKRHR